MLRWLRRFLRRSSRRGAVPAELRSLPPAGPGCGRRRISTTAEEFARHLARRSGR